MVTLTHKHLAKALLIALVATLGVGCSSPTKRLDEESFATVAPPYMSPPPPQQGSIYQAGYGMALFNDILARRVGDVLTIILNEQTNASKQATTNTSRDTSVEIENPTLFGTPLSTTIPRPFNKGIRGANLGTSLGSANSFEGSGDSAQSNSLTGNITVTVAEVLPNGNLIVQGQKHLTINQGDEYVRFSGIVRPSDIKPDNTVLSTKVANARIAYVGEGTLADANSQGWLARFFNSKWWPF